MDLLDEIARRSAEVVRTDASAIADTEVALRDVKAEVTLTMVMPATTQRRSWWLGAAAAAAVVGVVATGALVVSRERRDDVPPADSTVVSVVGPGGTRVLTSADAEVLFEAAAGSGDGQLGERDELRPLAPIVTPEGSLVIGDPVNSRWIVVDGGVVGTVPDDDSEFVWDAVLGADGSIYSLVYTWSNRGLVNGRVEYAQAGSLDAPAAYARNVGTCCSRLLYDGSVENGEGPDVGNGVVVVLESAGAPRVTVSALQVDPSGREEMIEYELATARWTIGGTFSSPGSGEPELHVLADGSAVVIRRQAPAVPTWSVTHIKPGEFAAGTEPVWTVAHSRFELDVDLAGNVGKWSADPSGLTGLFRADSGEGYRVLRFPLPVAPAAPVEPAPGATFDEEQEESVEATGLGVDEALSGTVLYEAQQGSGDGRLGLQGCTDCDPSGPLAPMVAADGTIVIPDSVNRRWVLVHGDVATVVAFGGNTLVHDAVLGTDGNVYWVEYDDGFDPTRPEVRVAPIDDLSAAATLGLPELDGLDMCCRTIDFDGSRRSLADEPAVDPADDGDFVVVRGSGDPRLSATLEDEATTVAAEFADGTSQRWTLDNPGLVSSLPELYPLKDGSVVAIQASPLSQDARIVHTVNHLRLDGTVATGNLPPGVTTAGPGDHWSVTPDGVTTLIYDDASATFQVVRYALPT